MLRLVLTAVVAVDLLSFYFFLGEARAAALATGFSIGSFSEVLSRPSVRGTVILIGLAGVLAFGRRAGRLWEGLLALGALVLLSTAHTMLFGSPWRHLFFGGACLTGWLIGLAARRYQGAPADESWAGVGSTALLGAMYFNSGISKVVYGGLTWISGLPVQSAIVAQSGMVRGDLAGPYRSWVVATPVAASVLSAATVAFELAGPLMLVDRRVRLCVALGLFGMHANIYFLTTHILYWESMVLLLAFALSPHPALTESPPRKTGFLADDHRYRVSVAVLAVCASFAIVHQAVRYAGHHPSPVTDEPMPVASEEALEQTADRPVYRVEEPTLVAGLRQVGPFTVGQTVAQAWSIESLQLRENGLLVTLVGEPGRVRFDLTCSSSHSSPFDVGDAHVLYWRDMEFQKLEAAGRAVQEELRRATGGRKVCEQLLSWRTAAQAHLPR
jgi:hypothetical protein